MVTVPLLPYIAKLGPNRAKTCSFSVTKYGAQQSTDSRAPDCGNGVLTSGAKVTANDPLDANIPSNSTFQQQWAQHIISRFGPASAGGLRYYIMMSSFQALREWCRIRQHRMPPAHAHV